MQISPSIVFDNIWLHPDIFLECTSVGSTYVDYFMSNVHFQFNSFFLVPILNIYILVKLYISRFILVSTQNYARNQYIIILSWRNTISLTLVTPYFLNRHFFSNKIYSYMKIQIIDWTVHNQIGWNYKESRWNLGNKTDYQVSKTNTSLIEYFTKKTCEKISQGKIKHFDPFVYSIKPFVTDDMK